MKQDFFAKVYLAEKSDEDPTSDEENGKADDLQAMAVDDGLDSEGPACGAPARATGRVCAAGPLGRRPPQPQRRARGLSNHCNANGTHPGNGKAKPNFPCLFLLRLRCRRSGKLHK